MRTANIHALFEEYVTVEDGMTCYMAGLPNYPRNFSRDTILSGIIAADHHLLDNQLLMSAAHQGKHNDPLTGEESGKIHHEYPGIMVHEPYVSTYNGCDTTALYLIGLEILWHLNQRESIEFLQQHRGSIERAIAYIERHIDEDNIFWEFPPPGAEHFSLHTTYWKDSIVPNADHSEEPLYPVTFALAQFQVARGLLAAGIMLGSNDLRQQADDMFKAGIITYINEKNFCVEQDESGRLEQASSDELHALAYIPKEYAVLLPLEAIRARAEQLITPVGIACTPQGIAERLTDQYHGYVVWIFEQALMHYGCRKFGLEELATVTTHCLPYMGRGQELLSVIPSIEPLGNDRQLWSVAAKIYFSDMPSLQQVNWL